MFNHDCMGLRAPVIPALCLHNGQGELYSAVINGTVRDFAKLPNLSQVNNEAHFPHWSFLCTAFW